MSDLRRLLAIAGKEVRVRTRDRSALIIMLLMPVALIFILGSALGGLGGGDGPSSTAPIAVVNLDQGEAGNQVADALVKGKGLEKLLQATLYPDEASARRAVERGDLVGAVILPKGLTEDLQAGTSTSIVVLGDPGRPISASILSAVAASFTTRVSAATVAARTTAQVLTAPPLRGALSQFAQEDAALAADRGASDAALRGVSVVEESTAEKKELGPLEYYAIGMTGMFLLFGAMYLAFAIARERQEWTLSRILTTATTRPVILGGEILGAGVVGTAQFGVLFLFSAMLGIRWGNPLAAWLIGLTTVFAVAGLGVFFATLGHTPRAIGGIAPLVIQVMAAVGGSFFPIQTLPAWLRPLHYLAINGWTIDGLLDALGGATVIDVAPKAAALVLMGLGFFAAGVWRLRWE